MTRKENGKSYKDILEEEKQNIIIDYWDGMSIIDIKNKYNLSKRCFIKLMKENGINSKRKRRYTINEKYFNKIDTNNKAYILGFLYADGYVDEKKNNVAIRLSEKDLQILKDISSEIEFNGEIRYIKPRQDRYSIYGQYSLHFSSHEIAKNLTKIGLYPNKSKTLKDLPKIPYYLYRHFIRGYFDGDGSIFSSIDTITYLLKNNNKLCQYKNESFEISIVGTNEFIIKMAKIIKYDTNINSFIYEHNGMTYLKISGNNNIKTMLNYLYNGAELYLVRKYEKMLMVKCPISEKSLIEN